MSAGDAPSVRRRARPGDVRALMREGVGALRLLEGLSQALLRLSDREPRDLRTRTGIEAVLTIVRDRCPSPQDTRLRVRIQTAIPGEAKLALDGAREVIAAYPAAGAPHLFWNYERFMATAEEEGKVSREAIAAWLTVDAVASVNRLAPRAIRDDAALARLAAKAAHKLQGRGRARVSEVAALPRVHAIDPDAAAIAYAHAPRTSGRIEIIVESATESGLQRAAWQTRIRPVAVRPWHSDPAVAAALAERAASMVEARAPHHVIAPPNRGWKQAVLAPLPNGYEAYIERADGRVDRLDVVGHEMWPALGAEAAAELAVECGLAAEGNGRADWPTDVDLPDAGRMVAQVRFVDLGQPSLANPTVEDLLSEAALRSFEYRVDAVVGRATAAAVIAFIARLPRATADLARRIEPVRSWDKASHLRFPIGLCHLGSTVAASHHRDSAAVLRALDEVRPLTLVAARLGPWKSASEDLCSGMPAGRCLHVYAEALTGCSLQPAAMRSLAGWRPTRQQIIDRAALDEFSDLAKLAAALWTAAPSRPPMTIAQLRDIRWALAGFGFKPPSVAQPGDRTWDEAVSTTAYAEALRHDRADVPGSAVLGAGIADLIVFVDRTLASIGLTAEAFEAARRAILVPRGRLIAGLERLSDDWHRSINRSARERSALVGDLVREEESERGPVENRSAPEDYPNPLSEAVTFDGVTIVPLRSQPALEDEADAMANCVSTYREDMRVGALLIYSLRSASGRSTLGLEVESSASSHVVTVFQHHGHQGLHVDAPPPPGHGMAAASFVESLARPDGGVGGAGWGERLQWTRRDHALQASTRPSEQILSPERRERLAAFDLGHLGVVLGRNERKLRLGAFRSWAERLVSQC